MIVKTADQSHLSTILSIIVEAQKWLHQNGYKQWLKPISEDKIASQIAQNWFYLVYDNEEIVAVFRLQESDVEYWQEDGSGSEAYYIHSLTVTRDQVGKGIGKWVVSWAIEQAKQNGKRLLRLDCSAANTKLVNYYLDLGFKPKHQAVVNDLVMQFFEKDVE